MIGVGGLFIFFNWAEVQKWFGASGECTGPGSSGNCSWDCQDDQPGYCWNGIVSGSTRDKVCFRASGIDKKHIASGCALARSEFLKKHPGGNPGPGPAPVCSGKSGNCNWDCKNAYCWTGTCRPGVQGKYCTPQGQGANRNTGCDKARAGFLQKCGTVPNCPNRSGNCSWDCKNAYCWECLPPYCNVKVKKICAVGPAPTSPTNINSGCNIAKGAYIKANGTQNTCNSSNSAAKMWIARCVASTIGRMAGRNPTNTQIYNGYQSILGTLAVQNNCIQNQLHTSSAAFNKNYAKLIKAVISAYTLGPYIDFNELSALNAQANTGQWTLGPWSPIGTFYTESGQPSPDTPYGYAYSTTLQQNGENSYDPYGDQRYSETVPANTMRVKVSN